MSAIIQESRLFGRVDTYSSEVRFELKTRERETLHEESPLVRYGPVSRKGNRNKREETVLRRMKGFLVELDGQEARVAFVQDGKTVLYDMPANHFRNAGIEHKNQPFQMDEIEMKTDLGMAVAYRFLPLAKASDAYIETLDFDEERRRKRDLILKKFAKSKG
jgi:hypothetical protein